MGEFANVVLSWFKTWPATVWSTIGGSAITLTGVMFSDWRNTRRLLMQHTFAAQESERARIAAVRKEVYLPAAGILANMQEFLISLATTEKQPENPAFREFAALIGKVSMVGETETVLLAQRLASDYTGAHTELMLLAANAQRAHQDVRTHQEYRDKALAQSERVGTEISKFLESGSGDEKIFKALQRSQAAFQEQVQAHWAQEVEALNRVSQEINRYMVKAIEIITPISDSSSALLISIRRELGQATDEALLLKEIKAYRDQAFRQLQALIESIDRAREEEEAAQHQQL